MLQAVLSSPIMPIHQRSCATASLHEFTILHRKALVPLRLYLDFCRRADWSRQMVDDHEDLLSNSVARLERIRHKHERLSKILISVKAGVEHLQDKLKSTASEVSS